MMTVMGHNNNSDACIILFLPLSFSNAFCFHALSWVIDT